MSYGPNQHQDGAEHYLRCFKLSNCGSSTGSGERGQNLLLHFSNEYLSAVVIPHALVANQAHRLLPAANTGTRFCVMMMQTFQENGYVDCKEFYSEMGAAAR